MPRGRPQKVDCAGDSTASDMAVAMASLFGRVDGENRVAGDPVVGGASAKTAPKSRSGGRRSEIPRVKVFPSESLAFRCQWRHCPQVS
jgi:hypothetical protein